MMSNITPESEWPMDPIGRKLHREKEKINKPVILGPPPDVEMWRKYQQYVKETGGPSEEELEQIDELLKKIKLPTPDESDDEK